MATLKALRDVPGSTINREDLGIVRKGDRFETSENDAQYLEREGYAERVAVEETAAPIAAEAIAETSAETSTDPAPADTT